LEPNTGSDQRLSGIESQISELKSLILQKASETDADKENKKPRARFEPASWPPQGGFFDIGFKMDLLAQNIHKARMV